MCHAHYGTCYVFELDEHAIFQVIPDICICIHTYLYVHTCTYTYVWYTFAPFQSVQDLHSKLSERSGPDLHFKLPERPGLHFAHPGPPGLHFTLPKLQGRAFKASRASRAPFRASRLSRTSISNFQGVQSFMFAGAWGPKGVGVGPCRARSGTTWAPGPEPGP